MISLGRYHEKNVVFDMDAALNKHIMILGKPGSGKSVEMQKISIDLAEQGKTVIIFDMHSVMEESQIFQAYKERFQKNVHEIDVYRAGISCNLFSPIVFKDGEEECDIDTIGSILDVIGRTRKLGSKQQATLRKALCNVFESGVYETKGFAAVDEALSLIGTTAAETIQEKLYPLTAHNVFRPGKFFVEEGKINILRLSKFDLETQEIIAEVTLSYLWRLANVSKFKENGIFLVIDEMHNLQSGKGCVLGQILAEGRKFNMNLILATQQLMQSSGSIVQQRLLLCGLILFFQPNTAHVNVMAKLIDPMATDAWGNTLRMLGKGEFVALGTLMVGDIPVSKPLKVSAQIAEKAESSKVRR